jgi:hypothetical protein
LRAMSKICHGMFCSVEKFNDPNDPAPPRPLSDSWGTETAGAPRRLVLGPLGSNIDENRAAGRILLAYVDPHVEVVAGPGRAAGSWHDFVGLRGVHVHVVFGVVGCVAASWGCRHEKHAPAPECRVEGAHGPSTGRTGKAPVPYLHSAGTSQSLGGVPKGGRNMGVCVCVCVCVCKCVRVRVLVRVCVCVCM